MKTKTAPTKNTSNIVEGGVIVGGNGGGSGIFQTEIGEAGEDFDSSDNDDIEQQMLNMSRHKQNQVVGQSSPTKLSMSKAATDAKDDGSVGDVKPIAKPLSGKLFFLYHSIVEG